MFRRLIATYLVLTVPLMAQTVEEKRQQLTTGGTSIEQDLDAPLENLNSDYAQLRQELNYLHEEATRLRETEASEEAFRPLLKKSRELRQRMHQIREDWRKTASEMSATESYALWHQPDVTVEQLVTDYGSLDHVYLIPKDIAEITLSMSSNLPVPRENWDEMLRVILSESGIGIHQANPYLRVLHHLKLDQGHIGVITDSRRDLQLLPIDQRVCFVLSPSASETNRAHHILSRFASNARTVVHLIGDQIYILATPPTVTELLSVYDFLSMQQGDRQYRMWGLRRGDAKEMADLLNLIFNQGKDGKKQNESENAMTERSFMVMPMEKSLSPTLFLLGTPEQIRRAEEILSSLEEELSGAQEKSVHRYTCKHSAPDYLAEILNQVHLVMQGQKLSGGISEDAEQPAGPAVQQQEQKSDAPLGSQQLEGGISIVVNPGGVDPSKPPEKDSLTRRDNFIVDKETGSIIMVLDPVTLDRMLDLLSQIDVPKTMVRVDVILFEKLFNDQTDYGLNFLRFKDSAQGTHFTGAVWNEEASGIFSFLMSRMNTKPLPAFDLAYNFLLSQQDLMINANPSLMTINQTKASIKIVEERSINEGTIIQNVDGNNVPTQSFVRAQYGITIEITPTVHFADDAGEHWQDFENYVTLETNITFDTTTSDNNDRPDIVRRNVVNQVRIPDGQSVILGGLRRKETNDVKQSVPLFGEVPYVGKLFSNTTIRDRTSETFIMLTPRIVSDPREDCKRIQRQELAKRPGDVPEFLHQLRKARDREHNKLLYHSMTMLFGPQDARTRPMEEWDGR